MLCLRFSCGLLTGCALLSALLLASDGRGAPPAAPTDLHTYETKYYVLHTDLAPAEARAVVHHITLMAEEYNRRTTGMGRRVDRRLPLYLVQNSGTYFTLGGEPGTAGLYSGDKLLAFVRDPLSTETWHVIQHEGFHQFADAAIGRELRGPGGVFRRGHFHRGRVLHGADSARAPAPGERGCGRRQVPPAARHDADEP